MNNIEFQQVTKSYGDIQVVPPLNLSINKGEFVVLVGPSGCGKTTTLRMLAGLEETTSGAIHINGTEVTHKRPGERDCAMVFQNYALYPHMTVRDNIGYAMKVHGLEPSEIKQRVSDAAHLLGLEEYLDRKPRSLSGGQRQRVAIGRALVRQPEVFLFDEPLSNLDAKLRVEMRTEIKQLQRRLGTTAVYVTHDQIEAMTMADRVVVMRGGHIEQVDAPINLYEKPANRFVASFIGSPSMNFFQAHIEGDHVMLGDQSLALSVEDRQRISDYGDITFGIRPEHCRQSESVAELNFTVDVIEPLGAVTLVLGNITGQKIVAQVDPRFPVKEGASCTVPIDMSMAHFFAPETEERC